MSHRHLISVLVSVLLAGCASLGNHSPKRAYPDRHQPLADTAIFSCAENPGYTCSIAQVDQRSTWNHYNGGERLWVRVLPGAHRFVVVASDGHVINWLSFEAKDALPGHVYHIELAQAPPVPPPPPGTKHVHGARGEAGPSLAVSYTDLGKMDSYTIHTGAKSFHPHHFTAHF